MKHLPHAIASTVLNLGETWLVSDISDDGGSYALIGHANFKNEGRAFAWCPHARAILIAEPTIESWRLLLEALDDDNDCDLDPTRDC